MCKMCLFCVGKNPTNLKSHIARQHKDIHSLLAKKEVEMKASKPTVMAPSCSSLPAQTLRECLSKKVVSWQTDSLEYKQRLNSICDVMTDTGYPLALIDNKSFKDMLRTFDPKFQPPASSTVMKRLEERWKTGKTVVMEKIQRCRKLTLCLDEWTKVGLSGAFLGISACMFDPSSHKAVHATLSLHQIQHPHTGEMLSECLLRTMKEWTIAPNKVLLIVTDNGANMVKAVRLLQDKIKTEVELEELNDDSAGMESDGNWAQCNGGECYRG